MIVVGLLAAASADAQSGAGPTVGVEFGKGVTIASADDAASINIRARLQVRGTAVRQPAPLADTTEIGVRRMRLVLQGNARGPALTYYVQLSFANLDMEPDLRVPLRDAYVTWTTGGRSFLRVGQMKVPFSRQRVVSSSAMQMVDRAQVVSELNLDRDVGVQFTSRAVPGGSGKVSYTLGVFGGEGRNRLGRDAGLLYTARVEASPLGSFDDYVEADLARSPRPRLAIGGGIGYNQRTNRPRSTIGEPYVAGDFTYRHAEVDAVFKQRGFSLTGEWMTRQADADQRQVVASGQPTTIASRSAWGAYLQAGQMLTARLEVSGRYGRLVPRPGTTAALQRVDEIAAGASYYLLDHNLKVQADYGAVATGGGRPRTHLVRTQLQLYF